jgi:uncharacterized SAM-binding protein YcdF (DUF218 family)
MSETTGAASNDGSGPGDARPGNSAGRTLRWIGRIIAALFAVSVVAVVVGFGWFLGSVPTTEPAAPGRADGIVVLTGGASRISDAIELLASGHGKRLLITGVHPSAGPKEIARHVPEHRQFFTCCVDFDRSALNTLGNATEARRWARDRDFHSLIVVTSAYHMPRAMAELGHQLPEVKLIPFPVVTQKMRDEQWWSSPATTKLLISEYAKFILAMVRMRIGPGARGMAAEQISATVPLQTPAGGRTDKR